MYFHLLYIDKICNADDIINQLINLAEFYMLSFSVDSLLLISDQLKLIFDKNVYVVFIL